MPIEQRAQLGLVISEPFKGPGSQRLAAEKLGLRCGADEPSRAIVDGASWRWRRASRRASRADPRRILGRWSPGPAAGACGVE